MTWAYSWIRPPSRARRRTRIPVTSPGGWARPAGGSWCSYLLQRGRQFEFVIEEPVLRFRPYGTGIQREQLTHLLTAMRLPSVLLAIIPMDADRHGFRPRESFDITDSSLVTIEMLSGFLSLTHPEEIRTYVTAWDQLLSIAVRGKAVRALIQNARDALDGPARAG